MRARNYTRARDSERRNYGPRAKAVRQMQCLAGRVIEALVREAQEGDRVAAAKLKTLKPCVHFGGPPSRAAHAHAIGMGGRNSSRRKIAPLCDGHHAEAGEMRGTQRAGFDCRYGGRQGWLCQEATRLAREFDKLGLDLPDDFEDRRDGELYGYEVLSQELGVHELGVHELVAAWASQAEARAAAWVRWHELMGARRPISDEERGL